MNLRGLISAEIFSAEEAVYRGENHELLTV